MKNLSVLLILSIIAFAIACQNDQTQPTSPPPQPVADKEKTKERDVPPAVNLNSDRLQTKDLVYSWVDKLNIRNAPSLKGEAITTVDNNAALEFSGERSKEKEVVVLRGVAYEDTWLRVITPDKKEGWVFGGAVKEQDEKKGNDPISDTKFNFPHFGDFDLSQWKKLGTRMEGGEVDYEITSYEKDDQVLEITKSDMGEMHYGYSYRLTDSQNQVLKIRVFGFAGVGEPKELTESVKDYTSSPATEYTRQQMLKKHYHNLNSRPVMVNGIWSSKPIKVIAPKGES